MAPSLNGMCSLPFIGHWFALHGSLVPSIISTYLDDWLEYFALPSLERDVGWPSLGSYILSSRHHTLKV